MKRNNKASSPSALRRNKPGRMMLQSCIRYPGLLAKLRAIVLFLALPGASAAAQEIRGSVLADSGIAPIPEVEVTALNDRGARIGRSVRTDSAGRFVITGVSGRVQLRAQRIGYAVTLSPFLDLASDETIFLELFMHRTVAPLLPVRIVERRRGLSLTALDEFERRMSGGQGTFITRDEIQRRNPRSFAELILGYAGLQIIQGPAGPEVRMRRATTSMLDPDYTCTPRFYLDGVQIAANPNAGAGPVMMLTGEDLYAVEIYRSRATVPAEFLGRGSQCGVIVVWTLRSAPPPPA